MWFDLVFAITFKLWRREIYSSVYFGGFRLFFVVFRNHPLKIRSDITEKSLRSLIYDPGDIFIYPKSYLPVEKWCLLAKNHVYQPKTMAYPPKKSYLLINTTIFSPWIKRKCKSKSCRWKKYTNGGSIASTAFVLSQFKKDTMPNAYAQQQNTIGRCLPTNTGKIHAWINSWRTHKMTYKPNH